MSQAGGALPGQAFLAGALGASWGDNGECGPHNGPLFLQQLHSRLGWRMTQPPHSHPLGLGLALGSGFFHVSTAGARGWARRECQAGQGISRLCAQWSRRTLGRGAGDPVLCPVYPVTIRSSAGGLQLPHCEAPLGRISQRRGLRGEVPPLPASGLPSCGLTGCRPHHSAWGLKGSGLLLKTEMS